MPLVQSILHFIWHLSSPVSSLGVEAETAADGSRFVLRRHLIQSPGWFGTQFSDQAGLELTAMFLLQPPGYWMTDVSHQVQLAERSWLNPSKIFPLEYQSFFFLWAWGFSYPLTSDVEQRCFWWGKFAFACLKLCAVDKFGHKSQSLWVFTFSFWFLFHPSIREGPLLLFLFFSSILKISRGKLGA